MATIIESALWTITDETAKHMIEQGLITECEEDHPGVLEIDKPVYHRALTAPDWFGFTTIHGVINSLEQLNA